MNFKMNRINQMARVVFADAAMLGAVVLLAACAAGPVKDPGAARARAELTDLQSNPNLASRAPLAIADAETAVTQAEQPQTDHDLSAHLVYVADHKVQIAKAQAQAKYDEDQRAGLADQNAKIQLDARTREADLAKSRNGMLQAQTDMAKRDADAASRQTDAANSRNTVLQGEADSAKLKNDALEAQLAALQAKKTDRGMVLTLGDVLFSSGRSDLKAGSTANLDRLVTFLNQATDRTVKIEGHTDNRGGLALNQALSQKRAAAVATYLTGRGIASSRVTSSGENYASPVADNNTEAGRQANRRVEVIIQTPAQ